ncbi:MAG: type IV pilus modification protein PilV [Gammaproteobacteria bacterium]
MTKQSELNSCYDTRRIGRHQRGVTMVEVLVSIIVFSIGLIGIARLQVVSKQSNYDSVQRVTATVMAQDILSRMRANGSELFYYVTAAGLNTLGRGSISTEPTPVCSSANSCSSAQLAAHDLWEIEQALDGVSEQNDSGDSLGGLSQPTACISGPNDGSAGVYTVTIVWRGKTELVNSNASTCGDGTGLYGSNNEYRRILQIESFIDDV